MRIALVCPYAWDAAGGVQVHVRQLGMRLRERGHDVLAFAPGRLPADEPWVRIVGRPIRVSYRGTVASIAPLAFRGTRAALAGFRPDVLHVHEPLAPSISMHATLSSRAPVIATVHAFLDRSRAMEVAAPLLRRVWAKVDVGVAVSETAAAFLRRALPEASPEIVPNGVDVGAFSDPGLDPRLDRLPPGPRIVWANRLDPQKGFPVAVAAFAKVLEVVPDATLVVIGDGRDRDALGLLPEAARSRVHLLGTVENDRVPAVHGTGDVFVSAATGQESFGIALVEAMAAGLPVVATDIPGYREVVDDGVEGLLVPPRDAEALAEALVRVLTEPTVRERLGRAGRERARRYDWPVVVERLEALYDRALESAGYDRPR